MTWQRRNTFILAGLVGLAIITYYLQAQHKAASPLGIPFERLEIEEVERQKKGNVKTKDAIPAQEKVFADSESWDEFWAKYGGREPEVDFSTNLVAGVFIGAASPGHGVEITRITYDPNKQLTTIHVIDWQLNPHIVYPTVVVYPADVVRFPKQPGKWKFVRTAKIRPM